MGIIENEKVISRDSSKIGEYKTVKDNHTGKCSLSNGASMPVVATSYSPWTSCEEILLSYKMYKVIYF